MGIIKSSAGDLGLPNDVILRKHLIVKQFGEMLIIYLCWVSTFTAEG